MRLTANQLAHATRGKLRLGSGLLANAPAPSAMGVAIDSRKIQVDDLFLALAGELRHGADFADEAFARGAAGILTDVTGVELPRHGWAIEVADAQQALWQLGQWRRAQTRAKVVAVTGSVGKSTTRQLIAQVLGASLAGSSSPENFNNHLGVPLSLMAVEASDDFAVLELAASAAGEINRLAALCKPSIGVITRIGDAHLGGFGSLEQLAHAKLELLDHLPADGLAVLNGDDPWLRRLGGRHPAPCFWYGRNGDCDLLPSEVTCCDGHLELRVDGRKFRVPLWGRHYVGAVLAAIAVGRHFGQHDEEIAEALESFRPLRQRCEVRQERGVTLIDDTYNASPLAMKAALQLLRECPAQGRRIVVAGDMLELGDASPAMHRDFGRSVVTICGADLLLACGQHAEEVVEGARDAGMPDACVAAFCEPVESLATLRDLLRPGDAVLLKASRAMRFEQLVEQLIETEDNMHTANLVGCG